MTFPDWQNILFFMAAASALIIIPGPAVLYIIAKSMEQGYRAGLVSVLGIAIGSLVHVVGAAVGLSALLVASATAFSIFKYLGAFYLIYLGIKKIAERKVLENVVVKKQKGLYAVFMEGVIVNMLNPKAAIFFFAFLPQFVNLERGHTTAQIIFLGLLFTVMALVSDSAYVLLSGRISHWAKNNKTYLRFNNYIIGTVYILLGVITLSMNHPSEKMTKE